MQYYRKNTKLYRIITGCFPGYYPLSSIWTPLQLKKILVVVVYVPLSKCWILLYLYMWVPSTLLIFRQTQRHCEM